MDQRLVNSEAVAHTPQPHIGEAYVGITRYISTMYRGAVPITEHQPADALERLRGSRYIHFCWRDCEAPPTSEKICQICVRPSGYAAASRGTTNNKTLRPYVNVLR